VKLGQLGEGGLIRKIRERFKAAVVVPIGDDAAVFDIRANESLVFCSDLLVENRHFVRDSEREVEVGVSVPATQCK